MVASDCFAVGGQDFSQLLHTGGDGRSLSWRYAVYC